MVKERTGLFRQMEDHVVTEYTDTKWPSAKRWRARIGIPRLTAERASSEAMGLLNSVTMSIHRNEPELHDLLEAAREATTAYNIALMRDNWRRFEGREK